MYLNFGDDGALRTLAQPPDIPTHQTSKSYRESNHSYLMGKFGYGAGEVDVHVHFLDLDYLTLGFQKMDRSQKSRGLAPRRP